MNIAIVNPISSNGTLESCDASNATRNYLRRKTIPEYLIYDIGCERFSELNSYGRLGLTLREIASEKEPIEILSRAIIELYNYRFARISPICNNYFPYAIADLAATGTETFLLLKEGYKNSNEIRNKLKELNIVSRIQNIYSNASETDIELCITDILSRLINVIWYLRVPEQIYGRSIPNLGWITTCAEIDQPHRPVNVPVAGVTIPQREGYRYEYSQFNEVIPVNTNNGVLEINTRFIIASNIEAVYGGAIENGDLPIEPNYEDLISENVILFIHGHSSRAEEFNDIAPHLLGLSRTAGVNHTIIAVDLPCCGYSQMFDSEAIDIIENSSGEEFPILNFLDRFIESFIVTLELQGKLKSIIGGSLGGNMGLRFGRYDSSQINIEELKIVSWSAASVWDSYKRPHDPIIDRTAKSLALNTAFEFLTEAYATTRLTTLGERIRYFEGVFINELLPGILAPLGPFVGLKKQPEHWYRDDWAPCKQISIDGAILDRQEIFNKHFHVMHWRIALEQLIFSHNLKNPSGVHLYELNKAKALLLAGKEDDLKFTNIYSATRTLASKMTVDGQCLLVDDTGHSIHNERPIWLAEKIVRFILT